MRALQMLGSILVIAIFGCSFGKQVDTPAAF
jgi:hypothetical protein